MPILILQSDKLGRLKSETIDKENRKVTIRIDGINKILTDKKKTFLRDRALNWISRFRSVGYGRLSLRLEALAFPEKIEHHRDQVGADRCRHRATSLGYVRRQVILRWTFIASKVGWSV